MPELPEVEVIVRELRPQLTGETIRNYDVYWHRTLVSDNGTLPGELKIHSLSRKGKYIIMSLSKGVMIIHLRMTGQLIISSADLTREKHLRMKFQFGSGKNLYFFDSRKFGRVYFTDKPEKILSKIGRDAIDPGLSNHEFTALLGNRKMHIKSFLLDQRFIAGLGNIYIDESLFRAGIHPLTKINQIPQTKKDKLFTAIGDVLRTAIRNMGTTISDYKTTGGGFGTNQNFLAVYDREDLPCRVCTTTISKIRVSGRGTHVCPNCQPEPDGVK